MPQKFFCYSVAIERQFICGASAEQINWLSGGAVEGNPSQTYGATAGTSVALRELIIMIYI